MRAYTVILSGRQGSITVEGKIGECNVYRFSIDEGQRLLVNILSADKKARFRLQWDAADVETASEVFEDQTALDRKFKYTDWLIWVTGTPDTAFTLTITVKD